jgi:cytochrome P450
MEIGAVFDPFADGFAASPYEQYARLRAEDPVHWSTLLEGWVLTRHDDVAAVLRDGTVSVELDKAAPSALVEMQRARLRANGRPTTSVVLRDDPDHNRLRKLLQQPFGPRPVEALRSLVTRRVDAVMDQLAPLGTMDVIADFAYPLPVGVYCAMLGMPEEDSPRFRSWTMAVARSLDPVLSPAEHARCKTAIDEMYAYLEAQVDAKRETPGDDIMTALVQAEDDGDRLTRDELVAQLVTLYVAGHEPTTTLIGNGLLALLDHPDQLALLRSQPSLLPNAIHELLRYDGPNQFVRRIAVEPLQLGPDVPEIAPGDVVYACIGAANRDPARWTDADQVIIDRPDAARHLQFGAGIHTCLGTHLARLQAEIALGALLTLPNLRLDGTPVWSERMVLRGLHTLPIVWD